MKTTITAPVFFLVLLLNIAGISHAATDTYSTGYGSYPYGILVTPPWSTTLYVPQFNSAKGTLSQVDISVTGEVFGSLGLENTKTNGVLPCTGFLKNAITVTIPSGGTMVANPTTTTQAPTLTVYDGLTDYGGTSGYTYSSQAATAVPATNPRTITNKATMATYYTGTGNVSFSTSAVNSSAKAGGAKCVGQFTTASGVVLSITYTYTPTIYPVPEPGTLALLGSGLLTFGIPFFRRLRRLA
jgi:hypothetical protein